MTVEQLVKDGQLQVENLKTVLGNDELTASQPCIVLVVDEDVTMTRLFMQGIKGEKNTNRCIMPLLAGALAELSKRVMCEDPDALAVMGEYFGLGREKKQLEVKAVKVGSLDEFLEVLGGKEAESDEQ